ncbi:MAG: cupredoxin domain-containing protein [Candidatus Aminicenantes bacterium]|nr:cupredoxin domain-containing protein [Candidatus Aminicenantes bacterium]
MTAKLIVTVSGIILIALVNWYFFSSKRKTKAVRVQDKGIQEVQINVKGGYDPDVIEVKKDIPVRLNFYRDETADCSDTIVFSDFNIRKPLPAYETTAVEFTPEKEGEFVFTCGMGMLKGKLIVK